MEYEDETGRDWSLHRFRGFLERGIPLSKDTFRTFLFLPLALFFAHAQPCPLKGV